MAWQRQITLTPRERDVFSLVIVGKLNKQIAAELGITENRLIDVPVPFSHCPVLPIGRWYLTRIARSGPSPTGRIALSPNCFLLSSAPRSRDVLV